MRGGRDVDGCGQFCPHLQPEARNLHLTKSLETPASSMASIQAKDPSRHVSMFKQSFPRLRLSFSLKITEKFSVGKKHAPLGLYVILLFPGVIKQLGNQLNGRASVFKPKHLKENL